MKALSDMFKRLRFKKKNDLGIRHKIVCRSNHLQQQAMHNDQLYNDNDNEKNDKKNSNKYNFNKYNNEPNCNSEYKIENNNNTSKSHVWNIHEQQQRSNFNSNYNIHDRVLRNKINVSLSKNCSPNASRHFSSNKLMFPRGHPISMMPQNHQQKGFPSKRKSLSSTQLSYSESDLTSLAPTNKVTGDSVDCISQCSFDSDGSFPSEANHYRQAQPQKWKALNNFRLPAHGIVLNNIIARASRTPLGEKEGRISDENDDYHDAIEKENGEVNEKSYTQKRRLWKGVLKNTFHNILFRKQMKSQNKNFVSKLSDCGEKNSTDGNLYKSSTTISSTTTTTNFVTTKTTTITSSRKNLASKNKNTPTKTSSNLKLKSNSRSNANKDIAMKNTHTRDMESIPTNCIGGGRTGVMNRTSSLSCLSDVTESSGVANSYYVIPGRLK